MEVFSEDTFHLSRMAAQYTIGLQVDPADSKYIKIAACTKVREDVELVNLNTVRHRSWCSRYWSSCHGC